MFGLEDGSQFAVSAPGGMGPSARSIGFLVADLDDALLVLGQRGHWTGAPAENATSRYAHFYAPDGQLYELVERKDGAA